MRDQMNSLHPMIAIAPVVVTDNTAQVSAIIDRSNYEALTFLLGFGTLSDADATSTVLLEHGNVSNLSDAAAVPDNMLVGTELLAANTFADDGECRKLGYIGDKRYVRLTYTPVGNTGNIPICVLAVGGLPHKGPTPNPPQ